MTAVASARLRTMLDEHLAAIWRLLGWLGVANADIDDAVQEVFWAASRRLDDIREGSERAFLHSIAVHVVAKARRAKRVRPPEAELDESALTSSWASPDMVLESREAHELLCKVLDAMPDELREVFALFELEELEIPEIASLLEIPVGTVGSRLRRAREEFQKQVRRAHARVDGRGKARSSCGA